MGFRQKEFIGEKRSSDAFRNSVWTLGGFATSQALRLCGNLILTRLLVPEAFGLMALVNGVMIGLNMFSDTGIRDAVIQHERGEQKEFLNTAWTIQVLRGVILWVIAITIAWPMSWFYEQPILFPLIAVVAVTAALNGLRSVMFIVHNRRVDIKPIVTFELIAQSVGLVTMILWAMIHADIWALVGGAIVAAAVGAGLSHVLLDSHPHRVFYETAAGADLFRFGRWILLSSSVTFIIGQADRFIVGALADMSTLGLFFIAMVLAMLAQESAGAIIGRVLFPIYTRVYRAEGINKLRTQIRRSSFLLYVIFVPVLLFLVAYGEEVVTLLYDPRYAGAGAMLKIIAAGVIGMIVTNVAAIGLLATGDSKSQAIMQGVRLGTFGLAAAIGVATGNLVAFLLAMACARWIDYIPAAFLLRRAGLWNPTLDLSVLTFSACGVGFAFLAS